MIESERLLLREYTMDDFDALYEILSDEETMRHYPAPCDEEGTRRWIQWNLQNYARYGYGLRTVVLKETGGVYRRLRHHHPEHRRGEASGMWVSHP